MILPDYLRPRTQFPGSSPAWSRKFRASLKRGAAGSRRPVWLNRTPFHTILPNLALLYSAGLRQLTEHKSDEINVKRMAPIIQTVKNNQTPKGKTMQQQEHPIQHFKNAIEPMGFRIEGLGYNGQSLLIHVSGGPRPNHEIWGEMFDRGFGIQPREAIQMGEDQDINRKLDARIRELQENMGAKKITTVGDRQVILSRFGQAHRKAAIQYAVDAFRQQHPQVPNLDHKIED